jgi:flagellar biosynthesis/type III secretory pathway protein FliH
MIAKNKKTSVPDGINCAKSYRKGYRKGYIRGYNRGRLKAMSEYQKLRDLAAAAKEQLIINHHTEYAQLLELARAGLIDKTFGNAKDR